MINANKKYLISIFVSKKHSFGNWTKKIFQQKNKIY